MGWPLRCCPEKIGHAVRGHKVAAKTPPKWPYKPYLTTADFVYEKHPEMAGSTP
jgi:hypothetical protein